MPAKPKILVMDDSQTVLEVTQEVLQEGGYQVVTLSSSAILPSVWNQERPDLALIDVNMPVMEGDSVVELMRRSRLHRCPLVLYSDQPAVLLRELVQRSGASGFIRKTHDEAVLLAEVSKYLQPGGAPDAEARADDRPLVFVVDPDVATRDSLAQAINQAGGQAVALESGEACLAELQQRRPTLVLLTLAVAETCCHAVREQRAYAEIPIVAVARVQSTADVMYAWRAGVDDILPQPIAPGHLAAKLKALRAKKEPGPASDGGELRPVLLIDRSPFARGQLGRLLECSGYRLVYARTGPEAVAMAAEHGRMLGAIVLDLGLTGAKPLELLAELKRHTPAPVIGLSDAGHTSELVTSFEKASRTRVCDKRGHGELILNQINQGTQRGQELRVFPRVPFFSLVDFRPVGTGDWMTGFSFDLSANGIFVTTLSPAAAKSKIDLRVAFPGHDPAPCVGEVAWVNGFTSRSVYSYTVGMGVRFVEFDDVFAKMLAVYVGKAAPLEGKKS